MTTREIIVLGRGGHATVVIDTLRAAGFSVKGCVGPHQEGAPSALLGAPYLGTEEVLARTSPQEVFLANAVGSLGDPALRIGVFQRWKERGFSFPVIRHPSAVVGAEVQFGEGVQLMALSVVQPACAISDNVIVNTSVSVDHDCLIAAHAHLAPGCTLSGSVRVGEGAHIGTGATVIQNVSVGEYSIIAAGAVVIRDVPARMRVQGVPAHRETASVPTR